MDLDEREGWEEAGGVEGKETAMKTHIFEKN